MVLAQLSQKGLIENERVELGLDFASGWDALTACMGLAWVAIMDTLRYKKQ